MADYVRSNQPTLVITPNAAYEAVNVQVVNPTPTGGAPAVTSNSIYRRETGSTGVWTLLATVGNNGSALDNFQRSAISLDYFVVTDTYSESVTYTITSPAVTGMWIATVGDNSLPVHYPYTDGGSETLDEQESLLQFVGRVYPVVEAGIQETQTVAVNVTIPFSDATYRAQVEQWRVWKRARRPLVYRDGRGRSFACRIIGPLSLPPSRLGTGVTCTLQRIDYTTQTVTLDPTYYNGGGYNGGGNGAYTNGSQGNGV